MITHQNHKFIYNGIASLELPNGMCINYDCEGIIQNCLDLISPDGGFRLVIEFFTSTRSAKDLIEEMGECEGHDILCPAHAVTTPTGLEGYAIEFCSGREHYEECTLDLGGDERCNFWFFHETGKPYDAELYERVKTELLNSITIV